MLTLFGWLVRARAQAGREANAFHGGRLSVADGGVVVGQTVLSNGFGGSVGLEAAYAQAGALVGSWLGARLSLRRADVLAIQGSGEGRMGVRAIAQWLNERGYRLKSGRFHNSNVADNLARTQNIRYYMDGKVGDLDESLSEADWIRVCCPAIVDHDTFLAAAATRAARRRAWSTASPCCRPGSRGAACRAAVPA